VQVIVCFPFKTIGRSASGMGMSSFHVRTSAAMKKSVQDIHSWNVTWGAIHRAQHRSLVSKKVEGDAAIKISLWIIKQTRPQMDRVWCPSSKMAREAIVILEPFRSA